MKNLLLILISVGLLSIATKADAQSFCYSSPVPIVRYNVVPSPIYRHHEDVRRYNSAPSRYGYSAPVVSTSSYHQVQSHGCSPPVKICTEIVSQRCQHVYQYDSCGRRICRNVTVTIYKDIYSNGGCRIWQHVSY